MSTDLVQRANGLREAENCGTNLYDFLSSPGVQSCKAYRSLEIIS